MAMTKEEFKKKWESSEGEAISFQELTECAVSWGIVNKNNMPPIWDYQYKVLEAANCVDSHEYKV